MQDRFTVCALFYGNHSDLARRLLESLGRPEWPKDIQFRFGLNAACDETKQEIQDFRIDRNVSTFMGAAPYYKYPLMRDMLHCLPGQPKTPYTMWFDDDTWIDPDAPRDLFDQIATKMENHHLIGAPYYMNLRGGQQHFIEDQPWFNEHHVPEKIDFITGGWFTIRTGLLVQHDWPPSNFEHNGGDVMLGALCQQYGYRLGKFTRGLCINADESGRCSSMRRRGFSQQPIGVDYVRRTFESTPLERPNPFFDVLDAKHGPPTHS